MALYPHLYRDTPSLAAIRISFAHRSWRAWS